MNPSSFPSSFAMSPVASPSQETKHHTSNNTTPTTAFTTRQNSLTSATFNHWLTQNQTALIAYARALCNERETARELSQEALLTAWRFRERFHGQRGDLGNWIRGILRNKWRESRRKKELTLLDSDELDALDLIHQQWEQAGQDNRLDLLERLLLCESKLSESFQQVIHATYTLGQKAPELAQELQTSEATLRKRLQRARNQIKACLSKPSPGAPTPGTPSSSSAV